MMNKDYSWSRGANVLQTLRKVFYYNLRTVHILDIHRKLFKEQLFEASLQVDTLDCEI